MSDEQEAIWHCEGCGAPLFAGDDYAIDDYGVAGCWATMTDNPVAEGRPCYAARVGKPCSSWQRRMIRLARRTTISPRHDDAL